jgi:hypothetical protein
MDPLTPAVRAGLYLPPDIKVRELLLMRDGATIAYTNVMASGTYVRFRIGMLETGEVVGLQQLTTALSERKLPLKNGEWRTERSDDIDTLTAYTQVGEPDIAPRMRLEVDGDNWLVVPLKHGDADDILRWVPAIARQAVGRKLLFDVSRTLSRIMHPRGLVHNDLKLANILIDCDAGRSYVSDFGSTQVLVDGLAVCSAASYVAPEAAARNGCGETGAAADVWALGAMFAAIHLDRLAGEQRSPFWWRANADNAVDYVQQAAALADFEDWRFNTPRSPEGHIDLDCLDTRSLWGTYFNRLRLADREVCCFVLDRMLCARPTERATMEQVHAFFAQLVARTATRRAPPYVPCRPCGAQSDTCVPLPAWSATATGGAARCPHRSRPRYTALRHRAAGRASGRCTAAWPALRAPQ